MNERRLKSLLDRYRRGRLPQDALLRELRDLPFEDLGFAKVDHHRELRCGFPEVIFGQGKTAEQIAAIAREILRRAATSSSRAHARGPPSRPQIDRRAIWHDAARC